jgi:uncharacterized OsmC-like protein
MMLAQVFHRPSRILAGCALLALSGCANQALNQQLATTREAVDQARIAGAAEAAPNDFQVAVDKLDRASAAANDRKKDDAMRLAQEAQVDANLARARSDATHARMAAAELAKSNELLRAVHRENEKSGGAR